MIVQGTKNPLVIQFDRDLSDIPTIIITMWSLSGSLVKEWDTEDVTIEGDTAICPLTEAESKDFPGTVVTLEAKGLDADGAAVFWDRMDVKMVRRNDRNISLEGSDEEPPEEDDPPEEETPSEVD